MPIIEHMSEDASTEGEAVLADLRATVARVGDLDASGLTAAQQIDAIRLLEELKCSSSGAQVVVTADFDATQREIAAAAGVPAERQGRGIAAQVALAKRESHHRGQRDVGLARVLSREMPCTLAALRAGRIPEYAAMVMARETACLSLEDRVAVDRQVSGDLQRLELMSVREIEAAASAAAYERDPMSFVERRRKAEADRHVTLRPAPDTMSQLSTLQAVKDGVAMWAVLSREADRLVAAGDGRSRSQIMADTARDRILHPGNAEPGAVTGVGLMINVIVPDTVLLGDEHGTGWVEGYGPVPGDLLREWIAANAEAGQEVEQWVRRLYASPTTGQLVAMDSRSMQFEGRLAEFLRLRDQKCRELYCDAPVRHLDHVVKKAHGGPASALNGQGTCEACNYAKEALGWSARPRPGPHGEHVVETTTPTGHVYTSSAPAWSVAERGLACQLGWVLTA